MNANEIENLINVYIKENSNYDEHREYLGISQVSGCPRRAYNNFMNGTIPDNNTYRMSFAGYEQERAVKSMLAPVDRQGEEIVALFDKRLRGHIDGVLGDDLLEIKSVSVKKFTKIVETNKSLFEHFSQCQLYMHFGNFKQAVIVYRCRETYEHKVFIVSYNRQQAEKLVEKAKRILMAIDSKEAPACECGYCK